MTNIDIKPRVPTIGRALLEMGKITPEDTEKILKKQKVDGKRFGDAAIDLGLITSEDVQMVLARQFEYSFLPSSDSQFSEDLISAYKPFSSQVEAFRALRSQLIFKWFNEGFKAISIVAANPGEGCSYLASNLAVVFSQLGKKTLLIDANLRDPRLHKIFSIKNAYGLSDILADRVSGTDALTNITGLSNLTVLGAGTIPPNPQELIGRGGFNQLIKYASSMFDVIIVDTPAVTTSSDAQMLASITQGVVIAARLNKTTFEDAKNLKVSVECSGASIIGAIVNDF